MVKLLLDYNGAYLTMKKMPDYVLDEVIEEGRLRIVNYLLATGFVPSNHFVKLKKSFFSADEDKSAFTKDYIKYILALKVNFLH
jgi:hypothetical protein